MSIGPLFWSQKVDCNPLIINGYTIDQGVSAWKSPSKRSSGSIIESHSGSTVYQGSPNHVNAPINIAAEPWSFDFSGVDEDAYFLPSRMVGISGAYPSEIFIPDPLEDMFIIPDTAKLEWTISRNTGYGLVNILDYMPRAFVFNRNSLASAFELNYNETISLVDDFYVSTGLSDTLYTDDLSAYAGMILSVRYYPLRYFKPSNLSRDMAQTNDLKYVISMDEHLPAKDWA